ncbi:MAG: hypothetical protein DWP94_13500 [Flavobacterium sp.]|nr:MAG: hypothetical protein DWP94_13500 [Flavobacterium sp.]
MKNISSCIIALSLVACTHTTKEKIKQVNSTKDTVSIPPVSSFFPAAKAKVLVVGVFHFDYPGLDELKTAEENKIDVLKEPKKSEMTALVEYIKKFKPTKIAVEANPGWKATEKLRKYKEGGHRDKRDERYQVAMRIASETGLDTLYEVNSYSMIREMREKDSLVYKKLTAGINWDYEDPYWDYVKNWIENDDKLTSQVSLLDFITYMNSEESHQYGYGAYLTGFFKSDDHKGADYLSMWWYNRNLRIFKNIQDITGDPNDRIMVVMGNGHAAILRQLFESSPEYDFVEFSDL